MPTAPLALCLEPGCGAPVPNGRCDLHRKDSNRTASRGRASATERGYDYTWSKFAHEYLLEHPHCVSEIHWGQGIQATDVDHIDGEGPKGPHAYDDWNLAAYCHPCHSRKTALHDGGFGRQPGDIMPYSPKQKCATPTCGNLVDSGWCQDCQRKQLSETRITIVAGAPASGKTTYVTEHKQPGDLVIDLDAIAIALGSDVTHGHNERLLVFMWAARDAILDRLTRPNDINNVWIIRTAPTNRERRDWWQATVIVMETPIDETKRRATTANRPPHWHQLIDDWWNEYQPNPNDVVIRG